MKNTTDERLNYISTFSARLWYMKNINILHILANSKKNFWVKYEEDKESDIYNLIWKSDKGLFKMMFYTFEGWEVMQGWNVHTAEGFTIGVNIIDRRKEKIKIVLSI